jgi:hypothetical protein
MIDECPMNIECRVSQTLTRKVHQVFLGEVVAVRVDEVTVHEGVPNLVGIDPIFYAPDPLRGKRTYSYWGLGEKPAAHSRSARRLREPNAGESHKDPTWHAASRRYEPVSTIDSDDSNPWLSSRQEKDAQSIAAMGSPSRPHPSHVRFICCVSRASPALCA